MLDKVIKYLSQRKDRLKEKEELVKRINVRENYFKDLSDASLKRRIGEYREGKYLTAPYNEQMKILVDVFSIVREASKRVFGMRHFDVQMLGGIFITEGYIAEMQTGEGKTLVATCPAVYEAVLGRKVHIVTVNEYLAERDYTKMKELYDFLGLSTGLIVSRLSHEERKGQYKCDIVYATNSELGFDYLRDNMGNGDTVQGALDFVLIDEADSILIDEARTPLIIAQQAEDHSSIYRRMSEIVGRFKENRDFTRDKDNPKMIIPQDIGTRKVEAAFGIGNIYAIEHSELLNAFNQALKAHFVFTKDKDYVVKNDNVEIVDTFTGRILEGRRYSDGLHQAIEAKEGVKMKPESEVQATITYQNFFRMYNLMSGMTGTAKTDEKEFLSVYGIPVTVIPKNKPSIRIDLPDVIFHTKKAKYAAVVRKVKECHDKGQPILVGTASIGASEDISKILNKEGIPHSVLNAKHDAEEAEIIKKAGHIGAVTIATNMAGRGTDIIPEKGTEEVGGLFILGTDKHESRRIDNQLRGRTARQGAKGETQFYISLEDDLFRYFGGERLREAFSKLNINMDEMPIESKYITKKINKCQKKVEDKNFDIRKHLLEYDDVMNEQRLVMYKQRRQILEANRDFIVRNIEQFVRESVTKNVLDIYASPDKYPEEWDLEGLGKAASERYGLQEVVTAEEMTDLTKDELDDFVIARMMNVIGLKEGILGEEIFTNLIKTTLLRILDKLWTEEITALTSLREGIGLQGYGQINPLVKYKTEAYDMFVEMENRIKERIVFFVLSFQIRFSR